MEEVLLRAELAERELAELRVKYADLERKYAIVTSDDNFQYLWEKVQVLEEREMEWYEYINQWGGPKPPLRKHSEESSFVSAPPQTMRAKYNVDDHFDCDSVHHPTLQCDPLRTQRDALKFCGGRPLRRNQQKSSGSRESPKARQGNQAIFKSPSKQFGANHLGQNDRFRTRVGSHNRNDQQTSSTAGGMDLETRQNGNVHWGSQDRDRYLGMSSQSSAALREICKIVE